MAMFIFASAILEGRPIRLFNFGNIRRDFTYIDDVTQAVARLVDKAPASDPAWSADSPDPSTSSAPWRIYNIGNNRSVEVSYVVELLESELGRTAVKELVDMQPGDVSETCADVTDLMRDVGFRPSMPIEEGVRRFAAWYRGYRMGGA
jgi:UDP-glucuronate 4-epimerase